jgi:hypothetical protein
MEIVGKYQLEEEYFKEKENRIFFSGTLFNHVDSLYPLYRNRHDIYDKIKDTIYNPGKLNYSSFINVLRNSKYSLDLLGVGDPNKRTFEILLSGSLILSEKNNLYWPFEEKLNEEVIFRDSDDYFKKLINLENNNELYNKCLINQYNIINKYFNIKWIKEYIIKYI